MPYRHRVRIGCLVAAMAALLLFAACSSTRPPSGAGLPAPLATSGEPGSSSEPATASGTATPTGVRDTRTTSGSTSTSTSPGTAPVAHVSVVIDQQSDRYTQNCPYQDTISAHVSADAPIDVTYVFAQGGHPIGAPAPMHLNPGDNAYVHSQPIAMFLVTPGVTADSIIVTGPDGSRTVATRTFTALCVAAAGPITAYPKTGICPYVTTFSVMVSIQAGPQTTNYTWVFTKAGVVTDRVTGSVTFNGSGPQSQVVSIKRTVGKTDTTVGVSFSANQYYIATGFASATCS
jgi:hypothetical protein